MSLLFLSFRYAESKAITYNPTAAADYASRFCKTYNHEKYKCWNGTLPECVNYPGPRVDCANFASQALIDGGLNFGCVKNSDVIGKDGSTKGETSVRQILDALQSSFCFTPVHRLASKSGDIVKFLGESHVAIVADPTEGFYYGHTYDICAGSIHPLKKKIARFTDSDIVYHFQDDDKCKKCERYWTAFNTCIAKMKDKATACEACDPATGQIKPKCPTYLGGRCSPSVTCEIVKIKDPILSIELGYDVREFGATYDVPQA